MFFASHSIVDASNRQYTFYVPRRANGIATGINTGAVTVSVFIVGAKRPIILPLMGNGLVMIVSDVGGSRRFVSADIALVHILSSCFFPSAWLFTPPRRRSDGPFATSICARYRRMTDAGANTGRGDAHERLTGRTPVQLLSADPVEAYGTAGQRYYPIAPSRSSAIRCAVSAECTYAL